MDIVDGLGVDTDIVDAKVRLHITTGANNHLVRLTRTELH